MPVHINRVVRENTEVLEFKYKPKLTEAMQHVEAVSKQVKVKTQERDSKDDIRYL
jgi:hypothetical protein